MSKKQRIVATVSILAIISISVAYGSRDLLFFVLDGFLIAHSPPFSYSLPANGACQVVTIHEDWAMPDRGYVLDRLEFRRLGTRLLIAAVGHPFITYSNNQYSFDPARPDQLTRITKEEWDAATVIGASGKSVGEVAESGFPFYRKVFAFGGKLFGPSGDQFADESVASLLSPSREWVALQSYDGRVNEGFKGLMGSFPSRGSFYVDVYRITSGERLFVVKGKFNGNTPHAFESQTRWIDPNELVLDFFPSRKEFILCNTQKAHDE